MRLLWYMVLLTAILGADRAWAADVDAALDRLMEGGLSGQASSRIVEELRADADEAVSAISVRLRDNSINPRSKRALINTLGDLRTEAARKELESVLGFTMLTASDVTNWPKLCKTLARPATDQSGVVRVHSLLSEGLRELLERGAEGNELTDYQRDAIALALRRVQSRWDLYQPESMANLRLDSRAAALRKRYVARDPAQLAPGQGLSPLEMASFNRQLLTALLPDMIRSHQTYVSGQYSRDLRSLALDALAEFNDDRAGEVISACDYVDERSRVQALASMDTPKADLGLVELCLSDQRRVSELAKRYLRPDDSRHSLRLSMMLRQEWPALEAMRSIKQHVADNYFEVVSMLEPGDAAPLVRSGLKAKHFRLWQAAVKAIARRPVLLDEYAVQSGLRDRFAKHVDNAHVEVVLKTLRRHCRQRGIQVNRFGLELAAGLLESDEARVRKAAAATMAHLSGERLGNNPAAWRQWWSQQR